MRQITDGMIDCYYADAFEATWGDAVEPDPDTVERVMNAYTPLRKMLWQDVRDMHARGLILRDSCPLSVGTICKAMVLGLGDEIPREWVRQIEVRHTWLALDMSVDYETVDSILP